MLFSSSKTIFAYLEIHSFVVALTLMKHFLMVMFISIHKPLWVYCFTSECRSISYQPLFTISFSMSNPLHQSFGWFNPSILQLMVSDLFMLLGTAKEL